MLKKIRDKVLNFIKDDKKYPLLLGIASGLYPFLFYYNSNYTLVNSWSQLCFFILTFLVLPCVVFFSADYVVNKVDSLKSYSKYVLPILNFTYFSFLICISTVGFKKKIIAIVLIIASILAVLLFKHIKKIVVFQLLLALLIAPKLIPDLYKQITYNPTWLEQTDSIENVVFKKKPNVYVIQPDGYANFSELGKGYYNFDNTNFQTYLKSQNFKFYNDFRSNYTSTLSSNSSLFAMNHHYYNSAKGELKELFNARQVIVGDNPVISIFKNNKYKTFLMLEKSYLLVNRPEIKYDFCNVDYSEISFMARGFRIHKDLKNDVINQIEKNANTSNFFFIQKLHPGHITTYEYAAKGKEKERLNYLEDLQKANTWLKELTSFIIEKDKNAIIIILADHGGYVGMEYTQQSKKKQDDPDLVKSMFSSILVIRWPEDIQKSDVDIKSSVNVFRTLFSYLGEDASYLNDLKENKSYSIINDGTSVGVYQLINEKGEVVFKPYKN